MFNRPSVIDIDSYDNFLTKKGKERRDLRKGLRESGLSRKDSRKQARFNIPKSKPAQKEAYLTLVKINFRGFAYKLDSIINGTNQQLLNDLKQKWRLYGSWNELVDAVNNGKDKKPFVCGGKCRSEILDIQKNNFVILGVTVTASMLVAVATAIISALAGIVKQAQIGNQQKKAIENSEREAEQDFNNLSPEEQRAILEAEAKLKKEAETTDNKMFIYIGIGVLALVGIFILSKKLKK